MTNNPSPAVLDSAVYDREKNAVELVMHAPGADAFSVQVSRGGSAWAPIAALSYLPADADPTAVYDYTAPLNVESCYRVNAYARRGELLYGAVELSNVLAVTPRGDEHWLKDSA